MADEFYEEVLATADPMHAPSAWLTTDGMWQLTSPPKLTFTNGTKAVITLDCHSDPPTVWVDPDLAWDTAAKHFWNAVHRIIGRPAPFPDIDHPECGGQ